MSDDLKAVQTIDAKRLAFELAKGLDHASSEHSRCFPQENYKAANIALGGFRMIAATFFPETFKLGNEETIRFLKDFAVRQPQDKKLGVQ